MRKSKYADVGQNGTTEQLLQAFNKVAGSRFSSASEKIDVLIDGAVEAFHEGRPENIHTLLQNLKAVKFNYLNYIYPFYFSAKVLSKLSERGDDKQGAMDTVLANLSAPDKQKLLDQALAAAVWGGLSPSFINLLHENGASFTAALPLLAAFKFCQPASIEKLQSYEKIMTSEPAVVEVGVDALQQQIQELNGKVDRLSSLMEAFLEANQLGEATPAQKPKPSFLKIRNVLT